MNIAHAKRMLGHLELKAARDAATTRFLAIAEVIKAEAGVTVHTIRKSLSGRATYDETGICGGVIAAPEGKTRKQLYILAHECGHVALKHGRRGKKHIHELEAEQWAHAALRRYGIAVPRSMTKRAKKYVAQKIRQAGPRAKINPAARKYAQA